MITLAAFTQMTFVDDRKFPGGPGAYEDVMYYVPTDKVNSNYQIRRSSRTLILTHLGVAFQSYLRDMPVSSLNGDAHLLSGVCDVGELVPLFYRKLMIAYENAVMGILYFLPSIYHQLLLRYHAKCLLYATLLHPIPRLEHLPHGCNCPPFVCSQISHRFCVWTAIDAASGTVLLRARLRVLYNRINGQVGRPQHPRMGQILLHLGACTDKE